MSATLTLDRCVVRGTHAHKGRTRSLDPATSAARQPALRPRGARRRDAPLRFSTGGFETGFIALRGRAELQAAGRPFTLAPYDALYVPRDSEVEVRPGREGCDLAEIAAPVERAYPLQFVSWETSRRTPACTSRPAPRQPRGCSTS